MYPFNPGDPCLTIRDEYVFCGKDCANIWLAGPGWMVYGPEKD
jgi:hypothetical protein